MNEKSRPNLRAANSELSAATTVESVALAPKKTFEQRHDFRLEKFGSEITEYLEGLDRMKLADERLNRRGF